MPLSDTGLPFLPCRRIALVVIAFMCASTIRAAALTDQPPAAIPETSGASGPAALTLRLSAGKSVYTLYEPVVVSYTIANPTSSKVRSTLRARYGSYGVTLSIQREGEEAWTYRGAMSDCIFFATDVAYEPHTVDSGGVIAFYNYFGKDLAFPVPGRYTLVATAQVWINPVILISSEPVSIEVREPSSFESRALRALGSKDRLTDLFGFGMKKYCGGEESIDACGEGIRSFLRRYPESAYAPAVTFYYGLAVSSGDLRAGPEEEQAGGIFDSFLRRWPGHPLGPEVIDALIRDLHGRGRRDESVEWLRRFEQAYPERVSQLRELQASIQQ